MYSSRGGRTTRIAHLAATYSTNGMPVDADKPWYQLIDTEQIVEQATAARGHSCSSIHCCVGMTEPTDQQVQIGRSSTRASSTS